MEAEILRNPKKFPRPVAKWPHISFVLELEERKVLEHSSDSSCSPNSALQDGNRQYGLSALSLGTF
jgi:hypothetical protein